MLFLGWCLTRRHNLIHILPEAIDFLQLTVFNLGKTSKQKKRFNSGIARILGGGDYRCPNFFDTFFY